MFEKYRKLRNLTVEQLASLAYLDDSTIKKIESGKREPSLITAKKLIKALDIPKDEVYEYYYNLVRM